MTSAVALPNTCSMIGASRRGSVIAAPTESGRSSLTLRAQRGVCIRLEQESGQRPRADAAAFVFLTISFGGA